MRDVNRNLIFDIGVNEGFDTAFYLDKGFQVVGVEANPLLAAALREALAPWIAEGRYTLIEKGIWSERTTLTFYSNISNSHWSSFIEKVGTRNNTQYETLEVPCITMADLIADHGVPHYMKIDIEGADRIALKALRDEQVLPTFISAEAYGVATIEDMHALGYQSFKIIRQSNKTNQVPPMPPREGVYVSRTFTDRDSGLFGLESPGDWMSVEDATAYFTEHIEKDDVYLAPAYEWHDIHAWLM